MVSRVQGTRFRAWGTGFMVSVVQGIWFREYKVHHYIAADYSSDDV